MSSLMTRPFFLRFILGRMCTVFGMGGKSARMVVAHAPRTPGAFIDAQMKIRGWLGVGDLARGCYDKIPDQEVAQTCHVAHELTDTKPEERP